MLLLVIALTTIVFQIPVYKMLGDTTAILEVNPLYGFLSNLGILGWIISAAVCLFSATIIYRFKSKKIFDFLLYSGLLSAYLGLDDLFLIHEYIVTKYFHIQENYFLALIGLLVIIYLLKFAGFILTTDYNFLVIAIFFLTTSVFIDVLSAQYNQDIVWAFHEDGFKWLGIVSWASYFVCTSYSFVRSSFKENIY
jgi:hypothetical protein